MENENAMNCLFVNSWQITCLVLFPSFFSSTSSCEQTGLQWMKFFDGFLTSSTSRSTHRWLKGNEEDHREDDQNDDDDDDDDDDNDDIKD